MSGPVRPETALYAPGVVVRTKYAEDGGRQFGLDTIGGIVLGVEDDVDRETGEKLGRVFRVLDFRSGGGEPPRLIVRHLRESELDLAGAAPADDRQLRKMRRRLHWFVFKYTYRRNASPPTDSVEAEAEKVIQLLWRLEDYRS